MVEKNRMGDSIANASCIFPEKQRGVLISYRDSHKSLHVHLPSCKEPQDLKPKVIERYETERVMVLEHHEPYEDEGHLPQWIPLAGDG